jgi:hypothetical protein
MTRQKDKYKELGKSIQCRPSTCEWGMKWVLKALKASYRLNKETSYSGKDETPTETTRLLWVSTKHYTVRMGGLNGEGDSQYWLLSMNHIMSAHERYLLCKGSYWQITAIRRV